MININTIHEKDISGNFFRLSTLNRDAFFRVELVT